MEADARPVVYPLLLEATRHFLEEKKRPRQRADHLLKGRRGAINSIHPGRLASLFRGVVPRSAPKKRESVQETKGEKKGAREGQLSV